MKKKVKIRVSRQPFFKNFSDGIRAPFMSLGFLFRNKVLILFVLIPYALNTALLVFILYVVINHVYPLFSSLVPTGVKWYFRIVEYTGRSLVTVTSLLIVIFLYQICGVVCNSYFLNLLSEKVEIKILGRRRNSQILLSAMISNMLQSVVTLLQALFLMVTFLLLTFALNFIPYVGNLLYVVAVFINLLYFFGLPYFEPPLNRMDSGLGFKLKTAITYYWTIVGTGLGFFVVSLIPLLGALAHQLTSVSAAIIFCEKMYPDFEFPEETNQ